MTSRELTCRADGAKNANVGPSAGDRGRRFALLAAVVAGSSQIGGCVSVTAPDKPIIIELNVNIKQEVIYRLAADVTKNIESNPEIF